jgi:predicted nucleic acid-binding protein
VLAQYIRKKFLPLEQALEIMSEAENMFKEKEYAVKSLEVLDKISKSNLSAYDLEYVVLAETLEIKLVTMDKKIVKEFPKGAILLSDF